MHKLYSFRNLLTLLVGGMLFLGVFSIAGCDRGDRVAVAETPSSEDSESTAKRSKKGMYSARIEQDSIVIGQPVEVALAIEPGNDLKINLDFPWKIEMQVMDGISFPTSTYSKDDIALSEQRATVPVLMNVAQVGEYEVEAIADFSVCNDDRCEILRGESVVVKVRAVEDAVE